MISQTDGQQGSSFPSSSFPMVSPSPLLCTGLFHSPKRLGRALSALLILTGHIPAIPALANLSPPGSPGCCPEQCLSSVCPGLTSAEVLAPSVTPGSTELSYKNPWPFSLHTVRLRTALQGKTGWLGMAEPCSGHRIMDSISEHHTSHLRSSQVSQISSTCSQGHPAQELRPQLLFSIALSQQQHSPVTSPAAQPKSCRGAERNPLFIHQVSVLIEAA